MSGIEKTKKGLPSYLRGATWPLTWGPYEGVRNAQSSDSKRKRLLCVESDESLDPFGATRHCRSTCTDQGDGRPWEGTSLFEKGLFSRLYSWLDPEQSLSNQDWVWLRCLRLREGPLLFGRKRLPRLRRSQASEKAPEPTGQGLLLDYSSSLTSGVGRLYRFRNRSTRPSVSTSFCFPV